jgi:SAM-dependent methyltransferase
MMKEHWERVYQNNPIDRLGWYESSAERSLNLIELCKLSQDAAILNVGAGATRLVDELLELEYQNIIANDISSPALRELQLRLGREGSKQVRWIVDDLTNPVELISLEQIDLWHDRAVLHFFNDQDQQDTYFNLLRKLVKIEGHVIIAAFNLQGAPKCSGLPVIRYDAKMLQDRLGKEFHLEETFNYTYTMPSGDTREYVYTLFRRKS